jgi:hypothetical protein
MKYPTTIVLNKKGQAKICIGSATTPKSQSECLITNLNSRMAICSTSSTLLCAHSPTAHVCKLANLFKEIINSVMAILHL